MGIDLLLARASAARTVATTPGSAVTFTTPTRRFAGGGHAANDASISIIARSIMGRLRANGPTQSRLETAGCTPSRLIRPYEVFKPYTPQQAAGMRIEPPVSVPSAKSTGGPTCGGSLGAAAATAPAATATAEPLDEPPGMRSGYRGFLGVPLQRLMPVTP